MRKKKYNYYRRMKVRAEMVASCEIREDGVREQWGRRNMHDLDPWNLERPHAMQKSWKMYRKKQYNPDGRGQKHILRVSCDDLTWLQRWNWDTYCIDHNIPHTMRVLSHLEKRTQYKEGIWCILEWEVCDRIRRVDGLYTIVKEPKPVYGYKYETLPEPRHYTVSVTDGYELIWWSDKDIGMEYILSASSGR